MQFVTASETAVLMSLNSSIVGSNCAANAATTALPNASLLELLGNEMRISFFAFNFLHLLYNATEIPQAGEGHDLLQFGREIGNGHTSAPRLHQFMFPFYALLCGATVYIQAHYLIDAIVGFLTAFPLYWLLNRMYRRWFA